MENLNYLKKGDIAMDAMVLKSQQWMNNTYGGDSRYTKVTEDGLTGWGTINGLIIAMQIEIGMSDTAAVIGPNTRNYFNRKYPNGVVEQDDDDEKTDNIHGIIQCALWCKGYEAEYGNITGYFKGKTAASVKKMKADMGFTGEDSTVTMEIMEQLLSMKQFVLLTSQGGKAAIRSIQQRINREYKDYTGIIPCDGLYGREMNTAIIQVLQAIEGFGPEVSNGNFGNGTKGALKVISSSNALKNTKWVWIASVAFVCNGYLPTTTTSWTAALERAISEFQTVHVLPKTGKIDVNTWMSLFTSKGNPDRAAKACDTMYEITAGFAKKLVSDGYEIVGRYITGDGKKLASDEIARILDHGLKYFPIFQEVGTSESNYTYEKGKESAERAVKAAIDYGIPPTVIYFAVDFDAMDYQVTNSILPYFKGVSENIGAIYQVGIYAPRNVCTRVCEAGYAVSSFVSDMSTGYSGNLGFRIPTNWNYDQFHEIKGYYGKNDLDKVAYRGWRPACSEVIEFIPARYIPPADPDTSKIKDTIFDVIELIKQLEDAYEDFRGKYKKYSSEDVYSPKANTFEGVLNYLSLDYLKQTMFIAAVQLPDKVFEQFINEEYSNLAASLQKYISSDRGYVKDNIGGKNDVAHLSVSTLAYSAPSLAPNYYVSWGGDLATGMADLHAAMEGLPETELISKSNELIGSENCRCNYTDLCDDADAIALSRKIEVDKKNPHILSEAMKSYYSTLTTKKRYSQYAYDGLNFSSLENLGKSICLKMFGAEGVLLFLLWGILTPLKERVMACVSLACYLWYKAL